ncbi:MAG: hypothetical protein KDA79_12000 [Planctomycetaceae bacterium]|nr:hypothetical protein [Planctomycetaceae bacterium]
MLDLLPARLRHLPARRFPVRQLSTGICLLLAVLTVLPAPALACPFCSAPSLTLSEQITQADAVILTSWVEGEKATENSAGSTRVKVVEVLKTVDPSVKKGDLITLPRYRAAKPGELFALMGTKAATFDWGTPLEVDRAAWEYIAKAPGPKDPPGKRLAYYMGYLEFPNAMVATDAYGEFANAPYQDITPLADKMPRERLRQWINSSETAVTRLGLYGLMLGLCGTEEDAALMEERILDKTEDFRLGIDGVMAGYLLLTRDKGLAVLDSAKLKNQDVPFSETYAAMQALRFMWTYGDDAISKERLRQSMQILLDRPELADLVIADLARWKDWSVQDRLMKLYGEGEYDIPSIRRAIVRYMLVCTKDVPQGENAEIPASAKKAQAHLDQLRKQDPKTVKEAERFFFIR